MNTMRATALKPEIRAENAASNLSDRLWKPEPANDVHEFSQPLVLDAELNGCDEFSRHAGRNVITALSPLIVRTSNKAGCFITRSTSSMIGLSLINDYVWVSSKDFQIRFNFSHWTRRMIHKHKKFASHRECLEFIRSDNPTRHLFHFVDDQMKKILLQHLIDAIELKSREADPGRVESDWRQSSGPLEPKPEAHSNDLDTPRRPDLCVFENPVDLLSFSRRMQLLCDLKLPISICMPFPGGFHAYHGIIDQSSISSSSISMRGPTFDLRIDRSNIRGASIVSRPKRNGMRTAIEVFDHDGPPILRFYGAQNPREYAVWLDVMSTLWSESARNSFGTPVQMNEGGLG